jgi:hypothetical protein
MRAKVAQDPIRRDVRSDCKRNSRFYSLFVELGTFVEEGGLQMVQHSTCIKLLCTAGLVGLVTAVRNARTASAQSLNDAVRTLNNIVNPGDAQRLEDQARRNGRLQEERYWHDYRAGLESPPVPSRLPRSARRRLSRRQRLSGLSRPARLSRPKGLSRPARLSLRALSDNEGRADFGSLRQNPAALSP